MACMLTELTARQNSQGFVVAADTLVNTVEKLFEGIEMPRSDFTVASLWQ
jgi:hypothetical protein